jgi:DNA-binding GntR family transcriptional regulator
VINKEIYTRALELRDSLNTDFHGMGLDLVVSYVLIEAIDKIKHQLERSYKIKSEDGFILDADQTIDRLSKIASFINEK